jgi:hypothetical protein
MQLSRSYRAAVPELPCSYSPAEEPQTSHAFATGPLSSACPDLVSGGERDRVRGSVLDSSVLEVSSPSIKREGALRSKGGEWSFPAPGTPQTQLKSVINTALWQPPLRSPIHVQYTLPRKIHNLLVGRFSESGGFCMDFVGFLTTPSRREGLLTPARLRKGVEFCLLTIVSIGAPPTKPLVTAAPRASLAPFTSPFPMEAC